MFNIIKKGDPFAVESVNILIYGEPGAGKTSLANTADTPLTLDFDKGAHRSAFRKDVLKISSWKQIVENRNQFMKVFDSYHSIVIDTVDTLLDFIGAYIVDNDPKLARNKLRFYGELKEHFSRFVVDLKTLNKDVIMIAHVKERDEGDVRIKRPAIVGGSYDRVLQSADFVGYLSMRNSNRVLNFNPSELNVGKNSARLPELQLPNFADKPDYFAELITEMKLKISGDMEKQRETLELLKAHSDTIEGFETALELNDFCENELAKLSNGIKHQVWAKIQKRAKQIGAAFDKSQKLFIDREGGK